MKYPYRQGEYLYLSPTYRIALSIHLDVRKEDGGGDLTEPAGDYEQIPYEGSLTAKAIEENVETAISKRSKELGWRVTPDGFSWILEEEVDEGVYAKWESSERTGDTYNNDIKDYTQAVRDIKAFELFEKECAQ